MIDPNLVLFAIEAGVRLGRKINEVLVEEDAQFAPLHSFKRGEALLDALDEIRDKAVRVVAPRIGNEQVVGHGAPLRRGLCFVEHDTLTRPFESRRGIARLQPRCGCTDIPPLI